MTSLSSIVLAVDAGGSFYKPALVMDDGVIINESRRQIKVNEEMNAEELYKVYQDLVSFETHIAEKNRCDISAIVVDTPGPFDYEQGVSKMTHKFKKLYGVLQRSMLESISGINQIYFLHDSSAFLLGEMSKCAAFNNGRIGGVMLGTGLGFAYSVDGRIMENSMGGPAYSIFKLPYRGKTAEDYISKRGIIHCYQEITKSQNVTDVKEIATRAKQGDDAAINTFYETGIRLGEVLSPVIKELGLEKLFIGGQISKAFSLLEKSFLQTLKLNEASIEVFASKNPDDSHLLGCEAFYKQHLKLSY